VVRDGLAHGLGEDCSLNAKLRDRSIPKLKRFLAHKRGAKEEGIYYDHSRGEQGAGERVKDTGIPYALRVSEPIHLCMPRIKIFISRCVAQEIIRPCFRANKFIYGDFPPCSLPPAPFPLLDCESLERFRKI
jgi:hypothetical protein